MHTLTHPNCGRDGPDGHPGISRQTSRATHYSTSASLASSKHSSHLSIGHDVTDSRTLTPQDLRTMTLEDELTTAAATGNEADVINLLQAGASVHGENRFGRTALQVMMMSSTPVARVLLKHGADPNVADRSTGATPLHDAARTGFLDTVRLLVQFGADPQAGDYRQCQPVDLARANNYVDVVKFLQSLSNGQ